MILKQGGKAMVEDARLRHHAELEDDLQSIISEVRTQTMPENPEDLRSLAKEACTPSDEPEDVDDWARRLSREI